MPTSIKDALMTRDKMSPSEAEELIHQAREQLQEYLDNDQLDEAMNICEEFFGLEPDYLEDLL